ncbi:hypothetical protein [uncultured Oscillibacter sp.]|uniref:hypothetical protein n=1 Tax=uncultured Oscillibacter sp. TaxID=876091 RepID=UPI0025F625FB|nr:hypothetical protein [uncultured Oscillibacter sp.]
MKYQAVLGSKALPGVGQITVPFPIPDSEYDHIIGMLENMSIGSPTVQDCWVLELDSPYPILNRLVAQSVNVDELDYLAKRLDSFSEGENIKFEAMASKLNLSSIRDFINLTFLYVSNEYYGEGIPIPFPATAEEVRKELDRLDADGQPLFIRGNGPVWHFEDRLDPAALYQETGVEKLNRLAGLVDAMDLDAQKVFAGVLRAESVNGLDDILDIASNLGRYEFIECVTSNKELGGWLVEHGQAGVDFPKEVWPYLDYAGIGAAYYADHGGAYTPNGYVKRREVVQT